MTGIQAKAHSYVEETQSYHLGKELECAEEENCAVSTEACFLTQDQH